MREAASNAPDTPRPPRRLARLLGAGAVLVAITLALFLLVEGVSSVVLFLRVVRREANSVRIAEARHTRFDPELGWVSLPGVEVRDLYGPGKHLSTNDRGFRGRDDVEVSPPAGKRRVICSGDSFTLGYGVSDEETWCAQLAELDPTLETVNMGQGGYGIGQAFLWHQRDGADLERSLHILAFVGDDFRRLGTAQFVGREKPLLQLEEGRLVTANVPVRRRSVARSWLVHNRALFRELRVVRLLGRQLSEEGEPAGPQPAEREAILQVANAIFDELARANAAQGARLMLLYLPAPWEHRHEGYKPWRVGLQTYAARTGVPVVDLVEPLRRMRGPDARALYIPLDEPGGLHLNEEGNVWVARHVLEAIARLDLLGETPREQEAP